MANVVKLFDDFWKWRMSSTPEFSTMVSKLQVSRQDFQIRMKNHSFRNRQMNLITNIFPFKVGNKNFDNELEHYTLDRFESDYQTCVAFLKQVMMQQIHTLFCLVNSIDNSNFPSDVYYLDSIYIFFRQVDHIDRSGLNESDALNLELFRSELVTFIDGYKFKG